MAKNYNYKNAVEVLINETGNYKDTFIVYLYNSSQELVLRAGKSMASLYFCPIKSSYYSNYEFDDVDGINHFLNDYDILRITKADNGDEKEIWSKKFLHIKSKNDMLLLNGKAYSIAQLEELLSVIKNIV